ncbi:MAG: TonB-dependent receptor [Bacteroidales bacterium]|jgi:hypothetical protein
MSVALNSLAQEKYKLPGSSTEITFLDFVKKAESIHPVRFFFRDIWVSDLRVSSYPDSSTISGILDAVFKGTSIHYYIEDSGNIIITNTYALKVSGITSEKDSNYIPLEDQPGLEQNQQTAGNASVEIGNPAEKNLPGKVTISGYITDKVTKEPLAGVTVFIQKITAGAISNAYGFYSLSVPRGVHLLKFSSIGLRDIKMNITLNGDGDLNVEMNSVLIPLKEVVVSADKNVTLRQYEVGVEKINMTAFKLLPTSLGEPDIIKNLMLLPGVQTIGEGSTGFNVRGGSPDQNLILLYNAPVYNASHFFGFFSAINSDIISDVTLYKGGIPSRYGERISSVLDIATKEGNRTEFSGSAGISPVTTHLMVQGPLIKNKLTIIFAARTTYSNWILGLMSDPALRNSRATFYDLNCKITWDIDKNDKIDFSSYYSFDSFRFNSDTVYKYNNMIFAAHWRHFFSSRLFSSITVNNSSYSYDVSSHSNVDDAFNLTHKINSTGLIADVNWFQGKNEFNFGLDLTRYVVSPGNYMPYNDLSLVVPQSIEKERGLEAALYADDKFTLTDFLSLNLGLRLSSFFVLGPQSVMVYNPAFSKSNLTIIDTLNYKSGSLIKAYAGPEIRASFNFKTSDRTSIKLNYNRTRQDLNLLSNTTSIAPTDIWKLCDYYIKPQIGDQIAAGFYEMLFKNRIEASVEVYYKCIRNMIDFKGGTNIIMDENIEKDIIPMRGKAYGIEFELRKTEGRIRYSLSYTYSRVFIKSLGAFSDEIINSGNWFPANYDKPNDLVVTLNYLFSRRFSFSSSYTWSTGRPVTDPVATYFLFGNVMVDYSDRNKYRIPDYSRLDLSFKISGNLKSHRIAHPNWIFSVYNLMGRQNVYSIFYKNDDGFIKGYKLSVFGQAIPTVTFSFDF